MTTFTLDPRLEKSSFYITRLPFCELRLKNNRNYPWIILVPHVDESITELFQLDQQKQSLIMHEVARVSGVMHQFFQPDKINVGALGNIVSQLHVHVIARFKQDAMWPHSLWQENVDESVYTFEEKEQLIIQLRELLQ